MKSARSVHRPAGLFAVMLFLVVMGSGCQKSGGVKLGIDIPRDRTVTSLAAVLQNPSVYDEKMVVMKGIVSGQCAALCEFDFRDGAHTVTVFPQGFKFPKLKTGKEVTVYAHITSGAEQVVVSALGLTMN